MRLFCFPYAGAGASIYFSWARAMPELPLEICSIQLPGRENRLKEPLFFSLPPLIDSLGAALQSRLDQPFCFFGHSMGALISFELTRYLRDKGWAMPHRLFLSGSAPPQIRESRNLHHLPDEEFIQRLAEHYRGLPEGIFDHPEMRDMMLPILRADFSVLETYEYRKETALDCPCSVFGGTDDPAVSTGILGLWQEQTSRPLSVRLFPGDHFFIKNARSDLLKAILSDLKA
jgi:medium-chain acyl-[acyl-carrier-protein] hydrolase